MNEDFEMIKQKVSDKYYDLFIADKLTNELDYFFGNKYIRFNMIDIFCSYKEEIYKGISNISINIESIDLKIVRFLESKNVDFEVREDAFYEDICIEELNYGEESTQLILDLLDFVYKNYLQN